MVSVGEWCWLPHQPGLCILSAGQRLIHALLCTTPSGAPRTLRGKGWVCVAASYREGDLLAGVGTTRSYPAGLWRTQEGGKEIESRGNLAQNSWDSSTLVLRAQHSCERPNLDTSPGSFSPPPASWMSASNGWLLLTCKHPCSWLFPRARILPGLVLTVSASSPPNSVGLKSHYLLLSTARPWGVISLSVPVSTCKIGTMMVLPLL